jgi:hypothetical protein
MILKFIRDSYNNEVENNEDSEEDEDV